MPAEIEEEVTRIAHAGGTPLVVADNDSGALGLFILKM